jgi:hypothetical protein
VRPLPEHVRGDLRGGAALADHEVRDVAVHRGAQGHRQAVVDGLAHEVVAEGDAAAVLAQQSGEDGVLQRGGQPGHRSPVHGGDVGEGEAAAQHRPRAQQLHRARGQGAQLVAHGEDELPRQGRPGGDRGVGVLRGAGLRFRAPAGQQRTDQEGVPAGPVQQPSQAGVGVRAQLLARQRGDGVGVEGTRGEARDAAQVPGGPGHLVERSTGSGSPRQDPADRLPRQAVEDDAQGEDAELVAPLDVVQQHEDGPARRRSGERVGEALHQPRLTVVEVAELGEVLRGEQRFRS